MNLQNPRDAAFCNSIFQSDFLLGYGFGCCVFFLNFQNLIYGKFGFVVFLSGQFIGSALVHHVGHIFGMSSFPKMFRIYASTIIARVADFFGRIKIWIKRHENPPVRGHCFSRNLKSSVSSFTFSQKPNHALARFFYVFPKSFNVFWIKLNCVFRSFCKNFISVVNHSRFMVAALKSRLAVTSATCFILPLAV